MNIVFKGIQKPYIFSANIKRPFSHSDTIEYVDIPDRPGALVEKRSVGVRPIIVEIWVEAVGSNTIEKIEEDMAAWLWSEEPEELYFSDNPNRFYMAMAKITDKPTEYSLSAKYTILFTCTEPFKKGGSSEKLFTDGIAVINNSGTVPTPPVIEIDVLEDVTHVDMISETGMLRIGEVPSMETPVFEPLTQIVNLPLTTTIGTTNVTSLDHGYVGGTMDATPTGFTATTVGATQLPRSWQGPARRISIPGGGLQDFRVDLDVELLNKSKGTGMIEVFGVDALDRILFVLGIEDVQQSEEMVQGKFQVGSKSNRSHEFIAKPATPKAWNDYKGTIRIHRRGNKITPYWALIDSSGNHVWKYSTHSYTDGQELHTSPLVAVIIAMRVWPDTLKADMKARNLRAFRYNSEEVGVPVIAGAGDKFIIDMENDLITLNGEDYNEFEFGSNFFDLKPGPNVIMLEPATKLSGKLKWKELFR